MDQELYRELVAGNADAAAADAERTPARAYAAGSASSWSVIFMLVTRTIGIKDVVKYRTLYNLLQ